MSDETLSSWITQIICAYSTCFIIYTALHQLFRSYEHFSNVLVVPWVVLVFCSISNPTRSFPIFTKLCPLAVFYTCLVIVCLCRRWVYFLFHFPIFSASFINIIHVIIFFVIFLCAIVGEGPYLIFVERMTRSKVMALTAVLISVNEQSQSNRDCCCQFSFVCLLPENHFTRIYCMQDTDFSKIKV